MSLAHFRASREGDRHKLILAMGVTASILALEVVGGLWSGSLALLADAGHMFTDVLALCLSLIAVMLALRPANSRRTWGYYRVEILAAFVNGVLLIFIAGGILWEAWGRFQQPREIHATGMTAVAAAGLLANLVGLWLLSHSSSSLNMRGVLWHLVGDTVSSVGVVVTGLLIGVTGAVSLDPLVSVLIAGVIVSGSIRLVREASSVLLESAPRGVDCIEVEAAIRDVPGVREVHDLHVWSITTGMPALSGHVVVTGVNGTDAILTRIKLILRDRFDIVHSTIQVQSERFEEVGTLH